MVRDDIDEAMRDVADTVGADDLVIAVCDHVHETLPAGLPRWHWAIPDPVPAASPASFQPPNAATTAGRRRFFSDFTSAMAAMLLTIADSPADLDALLGSVCWGQRSRGKPGMTVP